jgi:hypothetical protein
VAKKVQRISHPPSVQPRQPETETFSEHNLKKKKVPELLILLKEHTGLEMAKKSRKSDIIKKLIDTSLHKQK